MTHRFFLSPECFSGEQVKFPRETAHQILRVLRLKSGHEVAALDNRGKEYRVELTSVEAGAVEGVVRSVSDCQAEPAVKMVLYLCLTQREKFEWMLQKCTEVGAAGFVPVIAARSLVQRGAGHDEKHERWKRILKEAAEQCGRGLIPTLTAPQDFAGALALAQNHPVKLMAYEGEQTTPLTSATGLADAHEVALLIGPEGGFTTEEVGQAVRAGFTPVTLGRRILRMETAAVVGAALVLHRLGELG